LAQRGRFFVFPEFTLLYGVLGAPSPQPLLWFHPGLTYPHGGDPALERRVVESLDANKVDTVVIQQRSWFGTEKILTDFPKLQHWLDSQFEQAGSIGMFELYERKAAQDTGAHDNFFALGGDSFKAMRVTICAARIFAVDLVVAQVFADPTVAQLAEGVAGSIAPARLTQFEAVVNEHGEPSMLLASALTTTNWSRAACPSLG